MATLRSVSEAPIPPATPLLDWYDRHRRALPWRAMAGERTDPYRVWLSEIMLQQTTVGAVIPYYERFLSKFPSVAALAAAPEERVLAAWAGLGYYARARNLHACAREVAAAEGFPQTLEGLRALPGIGPYTAAAIGAIAFQIPTVAVDGNVERVTARIFAIDTKLPRARPELRAAATRLGDDPAARARPGDYLQALFDLGATVCTAAAPACGICPWIDDCAGRRAGIAAHLPMRPAKAARPVRHGAHFWLTDASGRVLLRRRPSAGLLGGMVELPGTPWRAEPWQRVEALALAPATADWHAAGEVRHVFTHFALRLDLYAARTDRIVTEGFLRAAAELDGEALPSVMRKCVRVASGG